MKFHSSVYFIQIWLEWQSLNFKLKIYSLDNKLVVLSDKKICPVSVGVSLIARVKCLPISINISGCHGSCHRSNYGAQDAGHAVQVVNTTGVLDLQFALQEGLNEEEELVSSFFFHVRHIYPQLFTVSWRVMLFEQVVLNTST